MFTKPKNAYSLTHTIIWDILYCYSEQGCKRPDGMVATLRAMWVRGAVFQDYEEIPARASTY